MNIGEAESEKRNDGCKKKQTNEIKSFRSDKFSYALSKTIERYVNSLRPSLFQNAYSEIYELKPDAVDYLHNQLQTQLSCNITSRVRKVCLSRQVISFIDSHGEAKESNVKRTPVQNVIRRKVPRESVKEVKDPKLLEKIHFKDELRKKLKKMEATSAHYEDIVFHNHDKIVNLGEKIKQRRDLLLKALEIIDHHVFSRQINSELTLLDLSKSDESDDRM